MKDTLYQLADKYLQLSNIDIHDQIIIDKLEEIKDDFNEKAINITYAIKNLEATESAIQKAIDNMKVRQEYIKSRIEKMKEYIKNEMVRIDIKEISCEYFSLKVRKNPPHVVIDSQKQIPYEYMRIPNPKPPEPDKVLIKNALLLGKEISGCCLEYKSRLDID